MHKGDFVYNKSYSSDYAYGAIKRLDKYEKGIVSPLYICFTPKEGVNSDFYMQYFEAGMFNREIYKIAQEGARNHGLLNISTEDFFATTLIVPSDEEQQKIAKILFQFDKIIMLYGREIQELKKMRTAYFELLFPTAGKNIPSVRFNGFVKPWKSYKLKEITSKIGSGKTPLGGRRAYLLRGIPLIRSQNVLNGQVDLKDVVYIDSATNEEMESSGVQYGDVLLNITGASIGRSAVYKENFDANVNQHVCIIRPNENVSPEFLQVYLSSYYGQKQIDLNQAGGGRQGLSFQHIGKMEFLFPSKDEQTCISGFFETFNQLIRNKMCKLEETQRKKKVVSKLLLTGTVRVKV